METVYFYITDYKGNFYRVVKPYEECTYTFQGKKDYYYRRLHIHIPVDEQWWGIRKRPRCGEFEN